MPATFQWDSPEGHALARRILNDSPLEYEPHDHQIEGVCVSLDGVDLLVIIPTGGGKTCFYIMYMIIILAVLKDPTLCPSAKFPEDPCLVVICPTIPLQLEMASKMNTLGLTALAINSNSCDEAMKERDEDLWVTARKGVNIIVTGPEQLKSNKFDKALRDDHFFNRCCGLGFDEVHLLNAWGPGFREDFLQVGFIKARMSEKHNPWILTTATLRDGSPYDNVVKLLGLRPGNFHVIRRSNLRPDVQILFRELHSSLTGRSFPELDWILSTNRSTIIFAKTISLGSSIYTYLCGKIPLDERSTRIRMYNSMNFESHNANTRKLMDDSEGDARCQIVIGTDTLSVGVDMAARQDAILIGDIADSDELVQKAGRVGRNRKRVTDARVIVYISSAARLAAEKAIKQRDDPTMAKSTTPPPDLSMAEMIVANCKRDAQNRLYKNAISDPPCKCKACAEEPPLPPPVHCNCSGCVPDIVSPILKPTPAPKANAAIDRKQRLTRIQKVHGEKRLVEFQRRVWREADVSKRAFLPPEAFFPSALIQQILEIYATLTTLEAITGVVKPYAYYLRDYPQELLDFLIQLAPELVQAQADHNAKLKAARDAKKAATATKGKAVSRNAQSDDEELTSGDEKSEESSTGNCDESDSASDAEPLAVPSAIVHSVVPLTIPHAQNSQEGSSSNAATGRYTLRSRNRKNVS